MRILHAPSNVANQAWAAAQGLRSLGDEAEVWHFAPNPYGFPCDRYIEHSRDPRIVIDTFIDALGRDFDVFHFHYGRSLAIPVGSIPPLWDLPILRALGKKIVFTFHGSEVRKKSEHMKDPWSYFKFSDIESDEDKIDKQLAIIRTYADSMIVAGAPLKAFVPDATYVPKAIDVDGIPMVGPKNNTRPLVVHAPSKRATKGTTWVLQAVDALQQKGLDFHFRLAENMPHDEFLALYGEADVIVDNVLLGDVEVSSLEAMALGKPVITRVLPEVRERHPNVPVVDADPDTLTERLAELIADPIERKRRGEDGRAYVETEHGYATLGRRLAEIYEQPTRSGSPTFPDWVAFGVDRRFERQEARIQALEVRHAQDREAIETRDKRVTALRSRLDKVERSLPYRLWRALKHLLRLG